MQGLPAYQHLLCLEESIHFKNSTGTEGCLIEAHMKEVLCKAALQW